MKYTYFGSIHVPYHVLAYERLKDLSEGVKPVCELNGLCFEVHHAVHSQHKMASFDGFSYCADIFRQLGYANPITPFGEESLERPWDNKYGIIRRNAANVMAKKIRAYLGRKGLVGKLNLK